MLNILSCFLFNFNFFLLCGTISFQVPYGVLLTDLKVPKNLVQVCFETPVTFLRGRNLARSANHSQVGASLAKEGKKN